MLAFEWNEEGDLRPGQDPAWEEGLQHQKRQCQARSEREKKTHMSASCRSGRSCAGIVDCAAAAARKGAAKNVLEEAMGGPAAWRTGPPPPC